MSAIRARGEAIRETVGRDEVRAAKRCSQAREGMARPSGETLESEQGACVIRRAAMRETVRAIDRWLRWKTGVPPSTDRFVLYI